MQSVARRLHVDRYFTALFHRDFSHYRNAIIKETGENSVMCSFITFGFHEILMLKASKLLHRADLWGNGGVAPPILNSIRLATCCNEDVLSNPMQRIF